MFGRKTLFWFFGGLVLIFGANLQAQSLRMEFVLPPEPYTLGKSYSFRLEADSTKPGSFSAPQFDASPLWELSLRQQIVQSFVENDQEHFGVCYEYQFIPKEAGELRLIPKMEWTSRETKETVLCPPKHLRFVFSARPFYQDWKWLLGGGGGGLIVLGIWRRQRHKKRKKTSSPQQSCESMLLEKLSELSRFRMEGDFKSYFAGLEQLYSAFADERKESLPLEYEQKKKELKHFSENVRFASQEVNPNDLEMYTEYLKQLLSNRQ